MPQMFSVQRSKPIVSRRSPEICHWQPQRWNNRVKKPSRDSKLDSNQPICLWTISAIAFLHWAYNGVAENHVCLQTCTLSTLENRPWNFEPSLFRFKEVKHWSIMFWKKLKKKTTNTKCKNNWPTPLCSTAAAWAANLDFVATFWTWRHAKMNLSELEWELKSWRHANKTTYSKLAVFMLKVAKAVLQWIQIFLPKPFKKKIWQQSSLEWLVMCPSDFALLCSNFPSWVAFSMADLKFLWQSPLLPMTSRLQRTCQRTVPGSHSPHQETPHFSCLFAINILTVLAWRSKKTIQSSHSAQSLSLVNEHGFWCQAKIGKGGHVTKSGFDWAWRMQLTCLCHSLSLCSEPERSCSMDCRREVPATCCKFTWKTVWSDFIHRVDERCDWFLGPKPSKSPSRKHWEQHCNLQPQDVHVCLKNAMLDLSPKFPVASGTKGPTGHVQNYIIETTIVEHPAFCLIFLSDIELIRMSAPEFHVTNQSKWRKCLQSTSIIGTVLSTVFIHGTTPLQWFSLPQANFFASIGHSLRTSCAVPWNKNLCAVLGY